MTESDRRQFLKFAAGGAALAAFPPSIARALAMPAFQRAGNIGDVQHVVILMQENRSFDHYFGTLRGVRGFGDRHPVPLPNGKPVWHQSDGDHEILPFHLDSRTTSALKVDSTPHTFPDAQAAWNQGRFGLWPKVKTPVSMGHYQRHDIPFQFALAEGFTLCDAYHCSITTGTDPNRIMFWSGSNHDPARRARGENCTDADAEVNNLRCWVEGALPTPGYAYKGSAFAWQTIPEVLEAAGISWRIYQDPNDNWTGLMHGALAFESFRAAKPGSPLYEKGMRHWSLDAFAEDVKAGRLPQVSWVLPSQSWSEHPAGSSPMQGAEFTARVLDALTSRPEVWGRSVLFLTFDENDGLFDHVPPPAPPSLNPDGSLAGKSTLDVTGLYLSDPTRAYRHADDPETATLRPWGLGPRVPMYVISPWSRGGWVNSQVFDHTSVGQFIERRFAVTVPAISPWHRAVSGDLLTAFDFADPNRDPFPKLPRIEDADAQADVEARKPEPQPPLAPQPLFQEKGMRRSRALPYALDVGCALDPSGLAVTLVFRNAGLAGAVFHVYDRLHLDRIPCRYTVEAGHSLRDSWATTENGGRYDLWVMAPNGFLRGFSGCLSPGRSAPMFELDYDAGERALSLAFAPGDGDQPAAVIRAIAYRTDGPWPLTPHAPQRWELRGSHNWYDFAVTAGDHQMRFAGRIETGKDSVSDPAV